MSETLTLQRPDDWHVHLRDDDALAVTVPATARQFARAIVMPNLVPPVTTTAQALAYRERIMAEVPDDCGFKPLMTLYLTDDTPPEELVKARDSGVVHGVKLYPAGATTNSASGVTDLRRVEATLDAMQELDIPLLIHGEVTDPEIDIFDREKVFIERHLAPLVENFPGLRVVLEHITTRDAVEFVTGAPETVAATVTAHHLKYERNAMLAGGIRPHFYCLPILKRGSHREALIAVATSGNPRFFLGTDSAPHAVARKEAACGCAGCYTAPLAMPLYAEVFEAAGHLDRLEAFASHFGPDFYRLPRNSGTLTLERKPTTVPRSIPYCGGELAPLAAGETIAWTVA